MKNVIFSIFSLFAGISATTDSNGLTIISSNANAGYYFAIVENTGSLSFENVYVKIITYDNATKPAPVDSFIQPLISLQYGSKGKGLAPGDTGYACIEYVKGSGGYSQSVFGDIDINPSLKKKFEKLPLSTGAISGKLGYYRCTITNTTSFPLYNCETSLFFFKDSTRKTVTGIYPCKVQAGSEALLPGQSVSVMFDYQPLCDQIDSSVTAYGLMSYFASTRKAGSIPRSITAKKSTIVFNALGENIKTPNSNLFLYSRGNKILHFRK